VAAAVGEAGRGRGRGGLGFLTLCGEIPPRQFRSRFSFRSRGCVFELMHFGLSDQHMWTVQMLSMGDPWKGTPEL
jgi:hypothetical protein